MLKYNLGHNDIIFDENARIVLPEPLRCIESFGDIVVLLFAHESKPIPLNNIWAFDSRGNKIWCIEDSISQNGDCRKWHIENEFFNTVRKENDILFAGGFYYNFYVKPTTGEIEKVKAHQ